MAKKDAVPAGFVLEPVETSLGSGDDEFTYTVEYLKGQNLNAWQEYYASQGLDADEVITGILNASQKQGATQGPKGKVRQALAKGEGVDEAVEDAQKVARVYVQGAPRTRTGGYTKKKAHNMGEEIARREAEAGRKLTDAELGKVYAEFTNQS